MTVNQRTRFEVLRRDNFTCRYCRSAENELTIDHVTPVALGGTDDPSNLVACCKDCNAGKSSTTPDATMVAGVTADALRWAEAMKLAIAEHQDRRSADVAMLGEFYDYWKAAVPREELPPGWEGTVSRYHHAGLDVFELQECVDIMTARLGLFSRHHFRYFCGICKNKVQAIVDRAKVIADEPGASDGA